MAGQDKRCYYAWRAIKAEGIRPRSRLQRREGGAQDARRLCNELLAYVTHTKPQQWRIGPAHAGRPALLTGPVGVAAPNISLSHCAFSVAAAITWHGEPGVDVQDVPAGKDFEMLAGYMGWSPALSRGHCWRHGSRFTRTWTQWESWIKTRATPLPPDPMEFRRVVQSGPRGNGDGFFRTVRVEGGWLSVALGRDGRLQSSAVFRRVSARQLASLRA